MLSKINQAERDEYFIFSLESKNDRIQRRREQNGSLQKLVWEGADIGQSVQCFNLKKEIDFYVQDMFHNMVI